MPESPTRTMRKFNPGMLQSDREVIDQFVVRDIELGIVLEVLRGNVNSQSCQHVLIVAPRGRGKTMLLARVAAELRTNSQLAKQLLPVRVIEESHEISDLADLWLETLFQLAREVTASNPVLGQELRATHASLCARWREQALEEHARVAVLEVADQLDRQLVLMVENLQALCESQDEDSGWRLRQVLQSEPKVTLLASATSRFKGLDDAEQPFFELFRTLELQPLTTEECGRLWRTASGDDVNEREIRPLEILTGGSPRLIVMVASFARHRSLSLLMEELAALIDEYSEYFRSHIEVLPNTERRVYLAVIDLWRPSKPAEIAARARRGIRLVSATLGRLVARGAVIVEGGGRKRLYSAAERLYCMYYKLRRERDEAAVVRHLIQFMSVFYGEAEMTDWFKTLIAEGSRSKAIHEGVKRALSDMSEIRAALGNQEQVAGGKPRVFLKTVKKLDQEMTAASGEEDLGRYFKVADRLLALVEQRVASEGESEFASIAFRLLVTTMRSTVAEQGLRGDSKKLATICQRLVEYFGTNHSPVFQAIIAEALITQGALHQELGNYTAAIETNERLIERFDGSEEADIQLQVSKALFQKGTVLVELNDTSAAISALEEVGRRFGTGSVSAIRLQVARSLIVLAALKTDLGDRTGARRAYEDVARLFPVPDTPEIQAEVARAMVGKGSMYAKFSDPEAAVLVYDEVVERFDPSDDPKVQVQVAEALILKGQQLEQLGDSDASRAIFDQVVERYAGSDDPDLLVNVAKVLTDKSISEGVLRSARASLARFEQVVEWSCKEQDAGSLSVAIELSIAIELSMYREEFYDALEDTEKQIVAMDEIIEYTHASNIPRYQTIAAIVLIKKGELLVKLSRHETALKVCEEFDRRLDAMTFKCPIRLRWYIARTRIRALLAQGRHLAGLDAFRSAYALFNSRDTIMISGITDCVRELVAYGIAERAIGQVLLDDREKSDTLVPLVTALRLRIGEEVRAPKEVLEVAADVCKYLKGRGPDPDSR